MKVVIQCAGQKREGAGRLKSPSGKEVLFVARPDLCECDGASLAPNGFLGGST